MGAITFQKKPDKALGDAISRHQESDFLHVYISSYKLVKCD